MKQMDKGNGQVYSTLDMLTDHVARLRSNEEQMNDEQRKRYVGAIEKLKKKIRSEAIHYCWEWISSFPIADVPDGKDPYLKKTADSLAGLWGSDYRKGILKPAIARLMEDYDIQGFTRSIFPIYASALYCVYAPYWTAHTVHGSGEIRVGQDTLKATHYNDILKAYWIPSRCQWMSKAGQIWYILPPTEKDIRKDQDEICKGITLWEQTMAA